MAGALLSAPAPGVRIDRIHQNDKAGESGKSHAMPYASQLSVCPMKFGPLGRPVLAGDQRIKRIASKLAPTKTHWT